MKKNNRKLLLSVLAVTAAAVIMLCFSGCFTGMLGYEIAEKDNSVGIDQFNEDDRAAADTLKKYFDAFGARDVQTLADLLSSECRLNYLNSANGSTRENFVEMMQSTVDNSIQELGENYQVHYDPESIRSEDAEEFIKTLNEGLNIDVENEPAIDCAKIVTITVWMTSSDGEDLPAETGSMLVYRYDNEWFIYGYAG